MIHSERVAIQCLMVFIVVALSAGCGETDDDEFDPDELGGELIESDVERAEATATDEMLHNYARGQADFAFEFKRAGFDADESAVFSSYSLAEVLTIASTFEDFSDQEVQALYDAVRIEDVDDAYDSSNTFRQRLEERIADADDDEVGYENLNDLWVEQAGDARGLFDLDTLKRYFGIGVRVTPLGNNTEVGAQNINEYVEYFTRGLIEDFIAPDQLMDVFAVATTVLYLKASWTDSFSEAGERDFYVDDETTTEVPVIGGDSRVQINLDEQGQAPADGEPLVMSVPLAGEFSFDIIAPERGSFADFRDNFDADTYYELLADRASSEVTVTMPSFKLESSPGAKQVMIETFGLPGSMFEPGKIGDIIHDAVIDVNETGIEAAAASAVTFAGNDDQGPMLSVDVDRSFMYMVRDRQTGMLMFSGQYLGD